VIIIQDIHQVIGRRELDFEAAYRDAFRREIGEDPGTEAFYFAWLPHGGGEGYEAVTLTSVADGAALDRYQERIRSGDLGELWTRVEGMRYSMWGSVHHLGAARDGWRAMLQPGASDGGTIHRLDVLELTGTVTESAPLLDKLVLDSPHDALLQPLAWWAPLFGVLDRSAVSVLSIVTSADGLKTAFDPSTAGEAWPVSAETALADLTVGVTRRLLRPPVWN
jgi:hypothetical protein